jgi:histidine triad (HIT) family protein
MPFTPEQSAEIKRQIIAQVKEMPNADHAAIIKQINQLDDTGLEAFLKQNNITYKDNQLQQSGTQSSDSQAMPEKPIFESIISGDLPSYKIAENPKAIAILELNPLSKGHCIILPKKKTTTEKIPKSALTLAQKLSKRIKLKLQPEDIKIETFSFQDYPAINIIPIYKDKPLEKKKAEEPELKKLQKKLETKTRAKRQPKPKSIKSNNIPIIRDRLPY